MNKKGIFLPLFIFATIFLLTVLAYVIKDTESKKEDLVGLQAITIGKLYDETEKAQLYLDLSGKYAAQNSIKALAENGGFRQNNRCEKTQTDLAEQKSYVIWNTCPVINPNLEFVEQLKDEIAPLKNNYKSSYKKTDFQAEFGIARQEYLPPVDIPEGVEDIYNYMYTQAIKNSNVINIENSEGDFMLVFSDVLYLVENSEGSILTLKPKVKFSSPDLSIYSQLHGSIENNCIKKEINECKSYLERTYSSIGVLNEGNLVKIDLPIQDATIRVAFDINHDIPIYQGPVSQVQPLQTTQVGNSGKCNAGVIGDSITENGQYVRRLNSLCSDNLFFVYGVVGQGTGQILERFDDDITNNNYKDVIILAGVNDIAAGRSVETIKSNLAAMYTKAKSANMRVIAVTITPWKDYRTWTEEAQAKTEEVNSWILSKPENVGVVVNVYEELSDGSDKLKGEFDNGDHLHPNTAGQNAIANSIFSVAYNQEYCQQLKCSSSILTS